MQPTTPRAKVLPPERKRAHISSELTVLYMKYFRNHLSRHTYTHNHFAVLWILSWMSLFQKKHSPTHTHRGHQSSLICFIHLRGSMASSLFNLRAWQSFFHNLSPSFLWSTSWPGTLHFILTYQDSSVKYSWPYLSQLKCWIPQGMESLPHVLSVYLPPQPVGTHFCPAFTQESSCTMGRFLSAMRTLTTTVPISRKLPKIYTGALARLILGYGNKEWSLMAIYFTRLNLDACFSVLRTSANVSSSDDVMFISVHACGSRDSRADTLLSCCVAKSRLLSLCTAT